MVITHHQCDTESHRDTNADAVRHAYFLFKSFFSALHGVSVRPSVRLSVKRMHCDKTEERSVQIFVPYERSFTLVF